MKKLICLLLITCLLPGCALFKKGEAFSYLDTSKEKDRVYYTDPQADALFVSVYHMEHLTKHVLYSVGDELHLEMHFDPDVKRINIQNARNYFTKITLIRDIKLFSVPYYSKEVSSLELSKAHLRVFVEDKLYLYEGIDQNTFAKNYFEDYDMPLGFKVYDNDPMKLFQEKVREQLPDVIDVRGVKPIKDSIVILQVETPVALDESQIAWTKDLLEKEIAPLYVNEEVWPNTPSTRHLGMILQFYEQEHLTSEYVYFNGLAKEWMDMDWKNYDFFRAHVILVDSQ